MTQTDERASQPPGTTAPTGTVVLPTVPAAGVAGPPGPPLPNGGATDDVLTKASPADQDVIWKAPATVNGLPPGGNPGDMLYKRSAADYDAVWGPPGWTPPPPLTPVGNLVSNVAIPVVSQTTATQLDGPCPFVAGADLHIFSGTQHFYGTCQSVQLVDPSYFSIRNDGDPRNSGPGTILPVGSTVEAN